MSKQIYRVEVCESNSLYTLKDMTNRIIDEWKAWEKDVDININIETGKYYAIVKIYK